MFRKSSQSIRLGISLALVWVVTTTLIAPTLVSAAQPYLNVYVTSQRFVRGLMVYRSDTGEIWLLTDNGQAYQFPSLTYGNLPDNPIPRGFRMLRPINGFGKIWGNNAWVRNLLGWPVLPEFGHTSQITSSGSSLYLTQFNDQIIQISGSSWHYVSSLPPVTPVPPAPVPMLNHFTADRDTVNPGDSVYLDWSITGTDLAIIEVYNSAGQLVSLMDNFQPTDHTTITVPTYEQQSIRVVLWGANYANFPSPVTMYKRIVNAEIVLTVQAQGGSHTEYTQAAFQQYVNGFMIWRADNGTILVFSGTQSGPVYIFPLGTYASLPTNPFIAPIGYITPINGFGKVWGNHDWIRNSLNWATQPEGGYALIIETNGPQGTATYLLPSGQKAEITGGYTWHLQ